jgi:hypothetical protein
MIENRNLHEVRARRASSFTLGVKILDLSAQSWAEVGDSDFQDPKPSRSL